MQKQKDNIRKEIIDASKKEFLKNGFKNASMRTIAKNSGVGLSNIYNYFRNKDEIYQEVLSPVIEAIEGVMRDHNSPENLSVDIFTSEEYQTQNINLFINLIEKHSFGLKLLLFSSQGSSFENFRDEYTDRNTKTGIEYIQKMKEKYPTINTDISCFFIHTMSSWWLTIIGEIITHDLSHEEIKQFVAEYIAFGTAGWEKIMKIE